MTSFNNGNCRRGQQLSTGPSLVMHASSAREVRASQKVSQFSYCWCASTLQAHSHAALCYDHVYGNGPPLYAYAGACCSKAAFYGRARRACVKCIVSQMYLSLALGCTQCDYLA